MFCRHGCRGDNVSSYHDMGDEFTQSNWIISPGRGDLCTHSMSNPKGRGKRVKGLFL